MKAHKFLMTFCIVFTLFSCANSPETSKSQQEKKSQLIIVLSEAALTGMQLSVKKSVQNGKVSQSITECVSLIDSSSFNAIFEYVVNEQFTSDEKEKVEEFLKSPLGIKYAKYDVYRLYLALGFPSPEPVPSFSIKERRSLEEFSETSAGNKFMFKLAPVLMSKPILMLTSSKIGELLSACGAKHTSNQKV